MIGHGPYIGARLAVANELIEERTRQDAKWGEQNHPDLPPYEDHRSITMEPPISTLARDIVELDAAKEQSSWLHILVEELAEARDALNPRDRRRELVQCGAVILAWIECIDRRLMRDKAVG